MTKSAPKQSEFQLRQHHCELLGLTVVHCIAGFRSKSQDRAHNWPTICCRGSCHSDITSYSYLRTKRSGSRTSMQDTFKLMLRGLELVYDHQYNAGCGTFAVGAHRQASHCNVAIATRPWPMLDAVKQFAPVERWPC